MFPSVNVPKLILKKVAVTKFLFMYNKDMSSNLEGIGRIILLIGLTITIIGAGIWLIARLTGWEKIPGTLKWESGNLSCVFPLLASIILSIVLTIVLNLLARWFNR